MISVAALTATALTGGHAFPKLSPLTSPMRIHSTFQDGGAGAKLALDRLDASAKDCAAAVQGSGCRSRGGNIKMQAVAAGAATMSVAQACAFMQDPSLSGMTVEPHGQKQGNERLWWRLARAPEVMAGILVAGPSPGRA